MSNKTDDQKCQMKWWGWGDPQTEFNLDDKPDLWPFILDQLGYKDGEEPATVSPVKEEDIDLPKQNLNQDFLNALKGKLGEDQIKTDDHERLVHCYGKSYRDLWRIRRGLIDSAPDAVLYPESEDDVVDRKSVV